MILLTSGENLTAGSGIVNMPLLDNIYHSFMDEAMLDMGRTITLHLEPAVEVDNSNISKPQAQQYNPFFGSVVVPDTSSRNPGVKHTHRDVEYTAHIVIGPLKSEDDKKGIGELKSNQAAITIDIGGLQHLKEALSVTIEGRRYKVHDTRPIGLNSRRYVIGILEEINESDGDQTGTNG